MLAVRERGKAVGVFKKESVKEHSAICPTTLEVLQRCLKEGYYISSLFGIT
jgi:hypothetical protein